MLLRHQQKPAMLASSTWKCCCCCQLPNTFMIRAHQL